MLPTPKNYAIWPAVVEAGKTTRLYIVPTERCHLFAEGMEYDVTVIHAHGDEASYSNPVCRSKFTVAAGGGILQFDYLFEDEQEHLVIISQLDNPKNTTRMSVYSLASDLYALRPMKGDFHSHSFRSDGKRDPAALAGHMREQGYDCFALTDHNRFFPGLELDEVYEGVNTGICRVVGEEVHAPESTVHVIRLGGKGSVTEKYVHDLDGYYKEVEEYLARVPEDMPENFKQRYARTLWATDKIHEEGGIAIFPHPYWVPAGSQVFNVCDEFAKTLLRSGMFDAYELLGGMTTERCNRSVNMWNELRAEGVNIPVVGSSDVHAIERCPNFPDHFTVCFTQEATSEGIKNAIKSGLSVAVEGSGTEYERQYRCYGSLRLVSYAQFLLREYFRPLQRLSQGIGVAMRAYAIEEAPKELIETQQSLVDSFMDRFFGRSLPVFPSEKVLRYEEKWRAEQMNGPKTKGSGILGTTVTMQI